MSETDSPLADEKRRLRQSALKNRGQLQVDSARVCGAIRHFLPKVPDGWILIFDAMPGEIDLSSLPADVPERDFALTRTPATGRILSVHSFDEPRETHRFGYTQPVDGSPVVPDSEIAAVMVPGLVFDRHGGRLGFGAGFYDRLLARLRPNVVLVGISDGFIVERVPMGELDVPMTHVATDAGVVAAPF